MILKGANYFQINWLVWASGSYQLICILYVLFFIFMNHFLFEVFIWHLVRSGSACVHLWPLSDLLNQEQEVIRVQRPTAVWLMLLLVFGSLVHPPDKVTAEKIQTSVSPQIWTIKGWSCAGFQLCSSTKPPWEPDASLLFGEAPAASDMKNPTGPFSSWNVPFLMGPDLHYGCRSISAFHVHFMCCPSLACLLFIVSFHGAFGLSSRGICQSYWVCDGDFSHTIVKKPLPAFWYVTERFHEIKR